MGGKLKDKTDIKCHSKVFQLQQPAKTASVCLLQIAGTILERLNTFFFFLQKILHLMMVESVVFGSGIERRVLGP